MLIFATQLLDGTAKCEVRETFTGKKVYEWDGVPCGLDRDGTRCAVYSKFPPGSAKPAALQICDLNSGMVLKQIELGPPGPPIALDPGFRVAAQSTAGEVRVWDVEQGKLVRTIAEAEGARDLTWDERGHLLFYCTNTKRLKVWDWTSQRLQVTTEPTRPWLYGSAMNSRGGLLANSDSHTTLTLWDASLGLPLISVNGSSRRCQFSADGRLLGTTQFQSQLLAWEIFEGSHVRRTFSRFNKANDDQPRLALEDRHGLLAAGARFGGLIFWDRHTGQEVTFVPCGLPS